MGAPHFLTAVVAGDMHDMQIEFVVRLLLTLAPLCPLKIELGCQRTKIVLMSPRFLLAQSNKRKQLYIILKILQLKFYMI